MTLTGIKFGHIRAEGAGEFELRRSEKAKVPRKAVLGMVQKEVLGARARRSIRVLRGGQGGEWAEGARRWRGRVVEGLWCFEIWF